MRPYPRELRARVVAAVESGEHSIPEVASLFGVGLTFVKKMLRIHRAGDDLEPRHGGGTEPSLKEPERDLLRAEVAKQSDITLEELQEILVKKRKVSVSQSTVSHALKDLGLPRKKRVYSPKSEMNSAGASSKSSRKQ